MRTTKPVQVRIRMEKHCKKYIYVTAKWFCACVSKYLIVERAYISSVQWKSAIFIYIYLQVKKISLKINAKIEDVRLNEDLKSKETRNGH